MRPDLAAMVVPLGRALTAAEAPILSAHGLTMWAYIVLHGLEGSVRTQGALAEAIGADKTRIISVLDDLQARGLISREPDPADRRARVLALTAEGRRVRGVTQRAIRSNEHRILAQLPAADRPVFLRSLEALARSNPLPLGQDVAR